MATKESLRSDLREASYTLSQYEEKVKEFPNHKPWQMFRDAYAKLVKALEMQIEVVEEIHAANERHVNDSVARAHAEVL